MDTKSPDAFRTISEVADDLDIPQHVLRFWETRFSQIKPLKRGGGRRYYRPDDVALLKGIRRLLYGEGYTIKGLQRILKDQGPRHVQAIGRGAPIGAQVAAAVPDMLAPLPLRAGPVDTDHAGEAPPSWRPEAAEPRPSAQERDDIAVLATVLAELAECQRVLRAVLQPQAMGEGA
ncbi:MerR family transcriptional regulator [Bosea caraganae]|uniref:MerR family transcriptional regulator n=1 Tax=Bosea caraganae TaxID=2763117 RepID=A0A370L6K9_9HYPH|nr:MerR family transcriptional regulator [Bosea caraganae]RDJ23523.1 MerR family transcriptional regulator [Bosea caraganae]RDJ24778.1 MerR family transcriptional regulator [Bosea caraganae]